MPPKLKRRDKRYKCKRCGKKTTNRIYCRACLKYMENNPRDSLYSEEEYKVANNIDLEELYGD